LAAEKNLSFRKSFIGRKLEVITLQSAGEDWTEALSDNYLKIRLAGSFPANLRLQTKVAALHEDGLIATLA
jgi:hypothetical protein